MLQLQNLEENQQGKHLAFYIYIYIFTGNGSGFFLLARKSKGTDSLTQQSIENYINSREMPGVVRAGCKMKPNTKDL